MKTGPRGGIPDVKATSASGFIPVRPSDLPSTDDAVRAFEDRGNRLTHFGLFGKDPLRDSPELLT